MKLILRTANAGKTQEAIKSAFEAAQHHEVMFVSDEMPYTEILRRLTAFSSENPAMQNRYIISTALAQAKPEMFDDLEAFDQYGTIVLDVNYAMSRAPWIKVISRLEEAGFNVVATQMLVKPVAPTFH
ncbi:hypothetical protein 44RRORF086c [Aeromonas phage 44RR2.8t]|uniref:Uncharacterized protein n=2 Tax=Biquartavirus 44RR2 TaxID=115987 RepID=Q6U9L6_9CAUD|nr:hypothetical protein ST44RRORF086c [Aeromonas phage 44RR2.8t]AAQ81405.1 hypothetical protein 44RRORF086c [Aeromonas phage 44RR2.8t]APU00557.1 hypothetical protein [Aeromonas phage 44RR2.8t.2]